MFLLFFVYLSYNGFFLYFILKFENKIIKVYV